MVHKELSFQEFVKAFNTLKQNKAIVCDGLNGNIIIDVYDSLKVILFKIFKGSLEEAVFPERLKIAKVIPFFKKGDKKNAENYWSISILPAFFKVLERIMYNCLYEYFMNNNLTVIKRGPPVSESSTRITNFIAPLVPNTNFVKRELKADLPGESNWNKPNWKTTFTITSLSTATNLARLTILHALL